MYTEFLCVKAHQLDIYSQQKLQGIAISNYVEKLIKKRIE